MNALAVGPAIDPWAAIVAMWAAALAAVRGLLVFNEGEGGGEGGAGGGEGGGSGDAGAAGGGTGGGEGGDDFEKEHAELIKDMGSVKAAREIVRLRGEAATHRAKAKEAEDALKSKEREAMSEAERKEAELKDAKAKADAADMRIVNSEIKAAAATAGAVDPDAVVSLLDRSGVSIDADGNVTGVKAAIDALLKAKPYLKGTPGAGRSGGEGGGGSGDGGGRPDMNAALRRAAGFGR